MRELILGISVALNIYCLLFLATRYKWLVSVRQRIKRLPIPPTDAEIKEFVSTVWGSPKMGFKHR